MTSILCRLISLGGLCVGLWLWSGCPTYPSSTKEAPTETKTEREIPESSTEPRTEFMIQRRFVGQTCKEDKVCPNGLYCEARLPEGYCTRECIRSAQCPGRSLCIRITFASGLKVQRCVHTCIRPEDCRTNFTCYLPLGAQTKICLPPRP